jgi:hypothetical protein
MHHKILIQLSIYSLKLPSTQLNDEENCPGSERKKEAYFQGSMQDKEKEKMKLNSNEEGGERKRTRAPKQVEYSVFVDRSELLDNETL